MLIHHPESDALFWDEAFTFDGADGGLCNDVTGVQWAIERATKEGIKMTSIAGDGFSIPETPPEAEKKPRNPRKKAEPKAAAKLIGALDFIGHATEPKSAFAWKQHVRFVNGWAVATDGIMRAGHAIEEDLTLCPHLGLLRAALAKAGGSLSMSALDSGRLSVSGGGGRWIIPCAPGEALPPVMVDNNIAPIDDRIKEGFAAVLKLAKDAKDNDDLPLHEATLLLRANTVVGCNGSLLLEFWHGNDLPPGLNIPQAFAKAVTKIAAKLTGFGWTEGRSVTFYFEDGSWIATQLGEGIWPDIDPMLNAPASNLEPCPKNLFAAIDAIKDFSTDGAVHFHDDKLKTTYGNHDDETGGAVYGASYDVDGLSALHSFSHKLLKLAEGACDQIDYKTHHDRMLMYNQSAWLRGVLTKRIA
jgi:hypothetical protein